MKKIIIQAFFFLAAFTHLWLKPMHERTRSKRKIEAPPIILNPDQFLETYIERSVKHKGERELGAERKYALEIREPVLLHKPSKATLAFIEQIAQECGFQKNLFVSYEKEGSSGIKYLDFDIFQLTLSKNEPREIFTSTILHEIGHAKLGHCIGDKKKTDRNTQKDNHEEEYAADNYSTNYLLQSKNYKPLAWEIIDHVHDPHTKQETFTHPAPIDRAKNILNQCDEHLKLQALSVADLTSSESTLLDRRTKRELKSALEKLKD